MYELIISEKPAAAKKIAESLADGKPVKEDYKGVAYYKVTKGKKDIIVGCAVGHLFGLAEKEKSKSFSYPVFDIEWKPVFETSKDASFSKKYFDTLKKIAKEASELTVACDFDVEGEVIGLNIVRYICNRNDAKRMKFSTLTKPDIVNAYEHALPHLEWGQAEAGETRHFLDYFYGINISRALTSAIKKAGMFKILSTGRVQGPTLKIIVDREKEIKAFKPVPYWEIELNCNKKKQEIIAWHKQDKFWEKKNAESIYEKIKKEKKTKVISVEKKQFNQAPPAPFDLTTLQTEAYRCFGVNPKITLEIAQDLYTSGYISYPRTSSQQLPPAIGYAGIIKNLAKQKDYSKLCSDLLKGELNPNNGKKTDPAHPAIFPTGIAPKEMEARKSKIYDLIVKRFLSTFAPSALRETVQIILDVKQELFLAKGTTTKEKGWHDFYAPYLKLEEEELPELIKEELLDVKKIKLHEKETQPPKRYTPSSIIKELEKRNLGTKSTRAEIVDTLYKRNYVKGEALEATDLGIQTIEILEQYCPKIIDEELTRHFEIDMDEIRERKKKKQEVIIEAKDVLTEILHEFKHKEKEIGEELKQRFTETRALLTTIGKCQNCKDGSLILRSGKFGKFAACDKYPDCKTTFSLPRNGLIEVSPNICEKCKYPLVKIIKKAKRPQELCINQDCPSKTVADFKEQKCPQCKEGDLILRKSIYGQFVACKRYPKCRYIKKGEKNEKENNKQDSE